MSESPAPALPWTALRQTDQVPWEAMERLAAALAAAPGLWDTMARLYEEGLERSHDEEVYEYLYVLGIVALAAPQLDDGSRRRIGQFLVEELVTASEDDDDLLCEALEATAGTLGPTILPPVLDAIEDEMEDAEGGWGYLWSMARLAADIQDAGVRDRAGRLACEALRRALVGRLQPIEAVPACWAVRALRHEAARPLLESLAGRTPRSIADSVSLGDLQEALAVLDGTAEPTFASELWDRPVREWLGGSWESIRRWWAEWDEDIDVALDGGFPDDGDAFDRGPDLGFEPEPAGAEPFGRAEAKVGRNDPCPCGSGRKYKRCCGKPAGHAQKG